MIEDSLGDPAAGSLAEAAELRVLEDLDDVGIAAEARWLHTKHAEAGLVQRHAHGDAVMQPLLTR